MTPGLGFIKIGEGLHGVLPNMNDRDLIIGYKNHETITKCSNKIDKLIWAELVI